MLEGQITNTCNFTHTVMSSVLLINLTDPQCSQLMENEKALSQALGKKKLATVIVLDSAEPAGWRVSSPHSKLGLLAKVWKGDLLILVRKEDWIGIRQELANGANLTLSLDSDIDLEELRLFPCILESPLRLLVDAHRQVGNSGTAVLHKDGTISQEMTVPIRCSFYGGLSSCKSWNLQDLATWNTRCTDISDVDVALVSGQKQEAMKQIYIGLPNNVTRKTCCFNSDTLVSVYNQTKSENMLKSRELSEVLPWCRFSDGIAESCKEESEQLELSQLCVNEHFVVKKYSKVSCYTGKVVQNICNPKYNCDQ